MRKLRDYQLSESIKDQESFYEKLWPPRDVRAWQLDRFNQEWQDIRSQVPYFKQISNRLPVSFSSWQEFASTMPLMDRKGIKSQTQNIHNSQRKPDFWKATGGSTSEPLQMGAWRSEREFGQKDLWFARSWFEISPSSRLFLIWGHSHLLGSGMRGRVNGARRKLSDRILGYYRFSAYNLSTERLQNAAHKLLEFKPDYLLAYAGALDLFARCNQELSRDFHRLQMKVAIATAESFPKTDSVQLISNVLGCPVVMEYGSVETGLVAHQSPNGKFKVFWRHYFLEGEESRHIPGTYEVLVTSLYPRACPLVRYRLGDLVSENPNADDFSQEFSSVIGRSNELLQLRNGVTIHSEAFSHAVKESPSISNFQVVQASDGVIILNYTAAAPLDQREETTIRDRLTRINPGLRDIPIQRVELLAQTVAGKTRRIFRKQPAG